LNFEARESALEKTKTISLEQNEKQQNNELMSRSIRYAKDYDNDDE
jgi:hypothetical protein